MMPLEPAPIAVECLAAPLLTRRAGALLCGRCPLPPGAAMPHTFVPDVEADALLIRAAIHDPQNVAELEGTAAPRFDPVMLAWLGFKTQEEARARIAAIERAPEEYQDALTARVDEMDQGEEDRRRRRGVLDG
jgi:hypothetical protein